MGNPVRLLLAACMSVRSASQRTNLGGWRLIALAVAGAAALALPSQALAFSDTMVYTLNGSPTCVASATITGANQTIITCGLHGHGAGGPHLSPDGQEVAFSFGCGIGVAPTATAPSGAGITYPLDDYALDGNCIGTNGYDGAPAWTPDGKRIVFGRSVPGSSSASDLWTMNSDGSNLTPLVTWAGIQQDPAVSPDGTKIAFMSENAPSGTQLGGDYVYVVNAATGGNAVQLAAGARPSFSPDGTKIAFLKATQTSRGTTVNLYTVPVSGGRATQITRDGVSNEPYWTPDGTKLLYEHTQANNFGPWNIYSINPDGTGATPLITADTQEVAARAPSPTVTFNDYLAGQLMPVLDFSSQEKWRPLNVPMFLGEQDPSSGAAWNQICAQSGGPCTGLSGETGLQADPSSSSYIVIHNSGGNPDSYTSPTASCQQSNGLGTTLHDCDSGPASAIYYHPAGPSPGGYTYIEYLFFYRYNQGYQDIGNHAGDFEGVTVAASNTSNTFAFAEFSEHGDWDVFLRDNLECYDNGGGPGSCGSESSPNGLHVTTFPASGSHANYPEPNSGPSTDGNTDGNAPWGRNLQSSTVAGTCPSNVPASPAETCGPALIALPPTASQGAAWTSGPERWTDWPGSWGDTTGGLPWDSQSPTSPAAPNPPDHGPHYFAPWTGVSCASGAACPSRASRPAMNCANWFGYSVAVLACDEGAMRAALRRGRLGHRGSVAVALPAQHRHAARAVGLAQAIGHPMKPGERATVSGSIHAGTYLWVHAAEGKHFVSSLFVLRRFHGTGTISVERGRRGYPSVVFIRGRSRQRPSMVLRRHLTARTTEETLSP